MEKIYQDLILSFLEEYEDHCGNRTCDDWNFPKSWTQEQVNEFVRYFPIANGENPDDAEDYSYWSEGRMMPEGCAISVIVYLLKNKIEKKS